MSVDWVWIRMRSKGLVDTVNKSGSDQDFV